MERVCPRAPEYVAPLSPTKLRFAVARARASAAKLRHQGFRNLEIRIDVLHIIMIVQ